MQGAKSQRAHVYTALLGVLCVLASLMLVTTVGCSGEDSPPYEDLLVRDALRAEPRIVAAVLANDRRTLADRMEREREANRALQRVDIDAKPLSAAEIITQVDGARVATGDDAWVATIVRTEAGFVEARPLPARVAKPRSDVKAPLPALEGEAAAPPTRDAEARALAGRAGDLLHDMLEETHATRLVRVTQWPVGAAAFGETIYVNAAWLVAMAALDEVDGGQPPASRGIAAVNGPEVAPLTLRGNPYATFTTLASCIADVTSRCESCLKNGACDAKATLSDFPDGRTECDFLGKDARRAAQLCALALTSVETVAECVKKDGCIPPSGARASTSLAAADPFLAKDACVRSLNLCLSGRTDSAPDRALVDVRVEGCQNPITACSSSISACSSACESGKCNSRGGPSCSSCKGGNGGCTSCSGCTKDSRTGSGTGYGSSSGSSSGTSGGSSGSSGSSSGSSGSSSGSSGSSSGSSGSSSGSSGSSSGSSGSSSGSSGSSSGSSGGSSTSSSSSGGSSSGGSSSGCGGGSSGCGNCGSSSNSGCGNCSGSSSSGCGNCGGSSCKCEAAPIDEAPFAPFSTMGWMMAPVLFLGSRARRTSSKRKAS